MADTAWSLEWLDHNSQRKYPLAWDDTCQDTTQSFSIPNDFLVSLYLSVPATFNIVPDGFFIQNIGAYASGYSLIVGYQPASGPAVPVATAMVARQTHTENMAYALGGLGDFADCAGKIVIGRLENIDAQPSGFFTFALTDARLDPDTIRPTLRGIPSIALVGASYSDPLTGIIQLIAGTNMRLDVTNVPDQNPTITINAIAGAGLSAPCVCTGDSAAQPILTINGQGPRPDGSFSFLGDDCLQITSITNGLQWADSCSQPCCGCPELKVITDDLTVVGQQAAALQSFVSRLDGEASQFNAVVLGSRLNDQEGCPSCG